MLLLGSMALFALIKALASPDRKKRRGRAYISSPQVWSSEFRTERPRPFLWNIIEVSTEPVWAATLRTWHLILRCCSLPRASP